MPLGQHGGVIGVERACIANDGYLAFFIAVRRDDASLERRREPILVEKSVRQAGGHEVGDILGRFAAPGGISQGDHVVDRPGGVGHDVGQYEARNPFGVVYRHDQGNASTGVMTDKSRTLDSKVIHQTDNHARLRH